jgi:hypothetical protein
VSVDEREQDPHECKSTTMDEYLTFFIIFVSAMFYYQMMLRFLLMVTETGHLFRCIRRERKELR